jgi:RNA 3'-terminal phosphate cyclase (ATP)
MLEIDGSHGEAGGQILRTSLSLSCITHTAFKIFNIRRARKRPGLMPQHLAAVDAVARIAGARVSGHYEGSTELTFEPGEPQPGDYVFDIRTAGSTSLLSQAVLPALLFTRDKSRITFKGGTHVPFSPSFDYLKGVFIPMLEEIGITARASILRYGFYPKGGGEIEIEMAPSRLIHNLHAVQRGNAVKIELTSGVARLPIGIALRQRDAALKRLADGGLTADAQVRNVPAAGQGTFVFIRAGFERCSAGFSALGERGKPAELVAEEASEAFLHYYSLADCLDPWLADQIVIYLAVAQAASTFTTSRITNHLLTNLWAIEKFLGISYRIEGERGGGGVVTIYP